MNSSSLLLLHTITWAGSLLRKRRNMWVQPINMERLEFAIFSPFPVQFLPNADYAGPVCVFIMRHIVDRPVVLNLKKSNFVHSLHYSYRPFSVYHTSLEPTNAHFSLYYTIQFTIKLVRHVSNPYFGVIIRDLDCELHKLQINNNGTL